MRRKEGEVEGITEMRKKSKQRRTGHTKKRNDENPVTSARRRASSCLVEEVRRKAGMESITKVKTKSKVRWLDHAREREEKRSLLCEPGKHLLTEKHQA